VAKAAPAASAAPVSTPSAKPTAISAAATKTPASAAGSVGTSIPLGKGNVPTPLPAVKRASVSGVPTAAYIAAPQTDILVTTLSIFAALLSIGAATFLALCYFDIL
jgi:hypothetical protein